VGLAAAAIGATSAVVMSKEPPERATLAGELSGAPNERLQAADKAVSEVPLAATSQPGAPGPTQQRVKLWELTTGDAGGYFYTASENEKNSAVEKFKFKVTGANLGYLAPSQVAGTAPLFRLRNTKTKYPSYLVAGGTDERDRLVASGDFVLEGVLGYASTSTCGGAAETLWRVTKNNVWRIVWTPTMIDIVNTPEWRLDGPSMQSWRTQQ
jgi:hypothetical protein